MTEYAIITGASQGIGAAIAKAFASGGVHTFLLARNVGKLQTVAREIGAAGGSCSCLECDVRLAGDIHRVTKDIEQETGRLPLILINNAGYGGPFQRADELPEEEWDRIFDINVKAAFRFCKKLLPGMKENGFGRIINIASIYGSAGGALSAAYAASKHALIGFTRSVAIEWGAYNVTANCISPGYIQTNMGATDPVYHERVAAQVPAARQGDAEEIARMAWFLSRPENSYINGADIVIDGGLSAGYRFAG